MANNSRSTRAVQSSVPSEELASLDLRQLRAYRQKLTDEEDRVSYWRRLTHARIDVLEAESSSGAALSFDDLVRVLGDTGAGRSRGALVQVRAAEPLPDLPELSEMWVTEVDPTDAGQVADALERLRTAEHQLTDYRRALHERIDEATSELILRYRANPAAALDLLPRP
ncbi:RsiG family protein [Nocardioides pacificus]